MGTIMIIGIIGETVLNKVQKMRKENIILYILRGFFFLFYPSDIPTVDKMSRLTLIRKELQTDDIYRGNQKETSNSN